MKNIVGLKDLRADMQKYITEIGKGKSFTVVRRSKPIFTLSPVIEDELWENAIDFTEIQQGGVQIKDLLSRL